MRGGFAKRAEGTGGYCTDVCGQLFSGMDAQLGNEQDGVTVGLHGRPSDGAQPVVCCVVQLWKVIAWNRGKGTFQSASFTRCKGIKS